MAEIQTSAKAGALAELVTIGALGGSGPTILLVEDEKFVRDVTSEVLRSAGYRVLAARNAGEGLELFTESGATVDLLLADIILPGQSGGALAERLKRERPGLKVLFVTGYAEQMKVSGDVGALLPKPFSSMMLLQAIREQFA